MCVEGGREFGAAVAGCSCCPNTEQGPVLPFRATEQQIPRKMKMAFFRVYVKEGREIGEGRAHQQQQPCTDPFSGALSWPCWGVSSNQGPLHPEPAGLPRGGQAGGHRGNPSPGHLEPPWGGGGGSEMGSWAG